MKKRTIYWLNWVAMMLVGGGFFIVWAATEAELPCAAWGISMVFVLTAYFAYCYERDN